MNGQRDEPTNGGGLHCTLCESLGWEKEYDCVVEGKVLFVFVWRVGEDREVCVCLFVGWLLCSGEKKSGRGEKQDIALLDIRLCG